MYNGPFSSSVEESIMSLVLAALEALKASTANLEVMDFAGNKLWTPTSYLLCAVYIRALHVSQSHAKIFSSMRLCEGGTAEEAVVKPKAEGCKPPYDR